MKLSTSGLGGQHAGQEGIYILSIFILLINFTTIMYVIFRLLFSFLEL
jgi:hypothetical protein